MGLRSKATAVASIVAITTLLAGCQKDWLQGGFDAANTRFNPENMLTAQNAAGLKLHWSVDLGSGASSHSNPVVATISKITYVFVATTDGYLEKWRTNNHTRQWRIPIGDNHFVAPWDGPTGSPAVQTIKMSDNSIRTQVIAGSPDGHYYAYDAASTTATDTNPPTQYWQAEQGESGLLRAVHSPTVTQHGVILIMFPQAATPFGCFPGNGCWTRVTWALYSVSPFDGTTLGGWAFGENMMPTDTAGNPLASAAKYAPSGIAYDAADQMAVIGEPNVFYDFTSGEPRDLTSGVLGLTIDDTGGAVAFSWEDRWDNHGLGVSATPTLSRYGDRTFVNSAAGLKEFQTFTGAGSSQAATVVSQYSSPAVAGNRVFVGTDNGYTEALTFDVIGTPDLTRQWRSGQAKDAGGHPIAEASPAVAGAKTKTADVPYVVFNTTASGGLKAWDAADSGTATAVASVAANATGLGGVAVSGAIVYVETADGHLAAYGL